MNRAKDSHFSVLGIGPEPKQHPCRTVLVLNGLILAGNRQASRGGAALPLAERKGGCLRYEDGGFTRCMKRTTLAATDVDCGLADTGVLD